MIDYERENREAMEKAWELLPTQRENLYYQSYAPDSNFLNIPSVLKLKPHVDANRMADAMNAVLKNHPVLHIRIFREEESGKYVQKYDDSFFTPIQIEELKDDELSERLERLNAPFAIENAKLYRCGLIRTDTGLYLYLIMHHIISDGSARGLLLRHFFQSYGKGDYAGEPDYSFYLLKQRAERKREKGYEETKAYFESRFDAKRKEGVPLGLRPDKETNDRAMATEKYVIERRENRDVNFLKTAALLSEAWYNQEEFAFLQTIYGDRFDPLNQTAAGILAASITIGLPVKGDETPEELLSEVHRQNNLARSHTEYSYIEENIGDPSLMLRFNYRRNALDWYTSTDLPEEPLQLPDDEISPGVMGLSLWEGADKIVLFIRYAKECYKKESVERFAGLFFKAVDYLESKENG